MATIYPKPVPGGQVDNTLILGPREALVIPFSFSGDYNAVKMIGMFSFTTDINENDLPTSTTAASITINGQNRNRQFFGFTTQDTFPGESGCQFVGILTASGASSSRFYTQNVSDVRWGNDGGGSCLVGGFMNESGNVQNDSAASTYYLMATATNMRSSGAYSSVMGVECVFSNVGTSSSQVTIYKYQAADLAFPVTGYNNLINYGNNSNLTSVTNMGTMGYKYGETSLEKPTYGFIYNPFTDYRIRIHGLAIMKGD